MLPIDKDAIFILFFFFIKVLNTISLIHLFLGTNHHQYPDLGHGCHNKGHYL